MGTRRNQLQRDSQRDIGGPTLDQSLTAESKRPPLACEGLFCSGLKLACDGKAIDGDWDNNPAA